MLYRRLLYRWMLYQSSHRSDAIRFDVYFDGRFFMCPLKDEDETILDLRLSMSKRLSFKEMNDLLLDKIKEDIWKWFYCKPKCTLEEVCLVEYYFKNLYVVFESDEEVTSIYRGHEKAKNDAITMSNSVGIGKGKVLLDDFEIVGNGKDKVVLDDVKDGLISTKSDGD
ncbi:hypothetical protein Tco_0569214 [Tanacetum coccineum]